MSSSVGLKHAHGIVLSIAILLAYTLVSTSLYSIAPTDLGLVSKLPVSFWIGLMLLGYLWHLGKKSQNYLIAAFVFTILFLFASPAVIKEPVWLSNSYYPFAESLMINSSGHLADRPNAPPYSYLDWPIFLYFSSVLTLIVGIPHPVLLKYSPVLAISLYGLLTFLILKVRLQDCYAILGAAWFLSSFWLRQQYFGPQSIAYVFFLLVILVISWIFFYGEAKKGTLVMLFTFLSIVLTATHVLTSFMSVVVLVALYATQRLVLKKPSTLSAELLVLSATIFLFYNIFLAGILNLAVDRIYGSLLGLTELSLSIYREPSRIIGSPANRLNYMSSWSIVLLNALGALISLALVLRNVRSSRQTAKEEYAVFWGISLGLFGLFALTMQYGRHEAYQRAFMFGLVPLAYHCMYLLERRPKILVAILTVLFFLNIPAQYGSDSFRLAADSHLSGAKFLAFSSPQVTSCFDELSFYIRHYAPLKHIRFESLIALPATSLPDPAKVNKTIYNVAYVVHSDLQSKYYLHYLGENPLDQVDLEWLNRIYDNQRLFTFRHVNDTRLPP